MFDAIVTGKLHNTPTEKISRNGNSFVVAKVITPTKDGGSVFTNLICFDTEACRALQALSKGDTVAVVGEATPTAYTGKDGQPTPSLDLLAHTVTSVYAIRKKRKATEPPSPPPTKYDSVAAMPDDLL